MCWTGGSGPVLQPPPPPPPRLHAWSVSMTTGGVLETAWKNKGPPQRPSCLCVCVDQRLISEQWHHQRVCYNTVTGAVVVPCDQALNHSFIIIFIYRIWCFFGFFFYALWESQVDLMAMCANFFPKKWRLDEKIMKSFWTNNPVYRKFHITSHPIQM